MNELRWTRWVPYHNTARYLSQFQTDYRYCLSQNEHVMQVLCQEFQHCQVTIHHSSNCSVSKRSDMTEWNILEMIVIIFQFYCFGITFHMRRISVSRYLSSILVSASFFTTFLSIDMETSIRKHDPFLCRSVMSGLLHVIVVSSVICWFYSRPVIMEAASNSEMSVKFYQIIRLNIPEDIHLHTRRFEALKSHLHLRISCRDVLIQWLL
jgi:hypothetical protein